MSVLVTRTRAGSASRVVGVALAALLVAGGCADDDTGSGTSPPTVVSADSPTTVGATVPSTTVTTTVTTTGPAEECTDQFGVDPVNENFPHQLSGLVVRDARTGDHPCFERVVIEFEGTGELPGYRVEYVADPVHLSPSDLTVEIAGAATLVLAVGTWLTNTEGEGYAGPHQIFPTTVQHIDELRVIENFEGMHEWAIGLDEQRGFQVTTLLEPPRIVIDIATPNG